MLEKEWNELTEDSPSDQFMFRLTQSSGKPVRDWSDEQIVEVLKLWKSDPNTEEFIRDILEHGQRKDLLQLLTPEKYYFPHGSSVSISKSARYVQNGEFHDHDYFEIECVQCGDGWEAVATVFLYKTCVVKNALKKIKVKNLLSNSNNYEQNVNEC